MALLKYAKPINFFASRLDVFTQRCIDVLADEQATAKKKVSMWLGLLGIVVAIYLIQIPDLIPVVGSIDNTVVLLLIVGVVIEKIKRYTNESSKIAGFFQGIITLGAAAYGVMPVDLIPDAIPGIGFIDDLGVACLAVIPLLCFIAWVEVRKARRLRHARAQQPEAAAPVW